MKRFEKVGSELSAAMPFFFLLQSFGYKCWVWKMLSNSHLALLLTLVCFVNDMVRFNINFNFCSFSQLCFYILMTSKVEASILEQTVYLVSILLVLHASEEDIPSQ